MKNPDFPMYKTPEIASHWGCNSCCQPLDVATLEESQYPPGRGQFRMQCTKCQMSTWFDLQKESTK